jgi:hypothetical protein
VRLHAEARAPGCRWISERTLRAEIGPGEHLPDGVVVLAAGGRVAIEVELTVKSARRLQAIIDELCARYEHVLYFCSPAPRRRLERLAQDARWPALGVRELPGREPVHR